MKKVIIAILFLFSFSSVANASKESEEKFNSAMDLYKGVEIQKAINVAEEAIALDPNVARYYTFLGIIYNRLNEYDKGETYFKKALSLDSNDAGALSGLGEVYSYRKQSKKAIEMYKKAISFAPNLAGMQINIGMEYILLYEQQGNRENLHLAKDYLKKAIELDENAYDAYQYLGKVFLGLKDYDNAIVILEKIIKMKPVASEWMYGNLGNVYYDLGSAYYSKKMYKEAISAYEKSLEIIPDALDAIFAIGACYVYSNDRENALQQYDRLKKLDTEKASKLLQVITKEFSS